MGWAAGFLGRIAATVITVAGHQVHVGSLDNARRALTEARRRSAERHEITTLLAAVVTERQKAVGPAVPRQSSATPDGPAVNPDTGTTRATPHGSRPGLPLATRSSARTGRLTGTAGAAPATPTRGKARSGKAAIPADLAIDVVLEPPGGSPADIAAGTAGDVAVDFPADVVVRVDPLPGVTAHLTRTSG